MRVVITGAAGEIGRDITEELAADHELYLIDKTPLSKQPSIVADLGQPRNESCWRPWLKARRPYWGDAFQGADVVVHLAANRNHSARWEDVLSDNVQATWNVTETAAKYRVPRVVFASSSWAVKALEQKLAPACYLPDGPKISSDVTPCPINPYGISKAFGELMGKTFVDEQKLPSFVAVRIGKYHRVFPDHERPLWIGVDDIKSLLRRCVEAEFEGFHVVYGVSAQPTLPYDLSHTCRLLSWKPRQLP